jgi:two-component system, LytTR family, sensor kinase
MGAHHGTPSRAAHVGAFLLVMGAALGIVLTLDFIVSQRYLVPLTRPTAWHVAVPPLTRAAVWISLVPLVAWLAHQLPLHGPARMRRLLWHAAAAVAIGSAVTATFKLLVIDSAPFLSGRWSLIYMPEWVHIYLVVVAVTHAFAAHERELAKERLSRELRAELAEAQLRALRNQLHPHFVFNTLQAVSTLMYRDVASADALLGDLGALLRRLLDHLEQDEVSLGEEVAFVESYLAIERARVGDLLHIHMDVGESVRGCRIPTLLLQPLFENAVKHGVLARGRGVLSLRARRVESRVEIFVQDDGPGLPPGFDASRFGVGLRTIHARLRAAYGTTYEFRLENDAGGGVCARLELPWRCREDAEAA